MKTWGSTMTLLAKQTGLSMEKLASSVQKVTDESNELKEKTSEVLEEIKEEMALVSMLTAIYAALRWAVLGLAAAYMALAFAMMVAKSAASAGSLLGAIDFSGATDVLGQTADALSSGGSSGTTPGSDSSTKSSGSTPKTGDTVTYTGKYYNDSYGDSSSTGSKYSGVEDGVVIDKVVQNPQNNQEYLYHIKSADGKYGDLGWVTGS
jgi:uncharacterized membrane protein YgcG